MFILNRKDLNEAVLGVFVGAVVFLAALYFRSSIASYIGETLTTLMFLIFSVGWLAQIIGAIDGWRFMRDSERGERDSEPDRWGGVPSSRMKAADRLLGEGKISFADFIELAGDEVGREKEEALRKKEAVQQHRRKAHRLGIFLVVNAGCCRRSRPPRHSPMPNGASQHARS
jgi:hypothetical protein